MKILTIHADFIEFEVKKKALKEAEKASKKKKKVKECLVVFTAVEGNDEKDTKSIVKKYVKEVEDIAKKVKAKNIVLYPYAHLSSDLASPAKALLVMKDAEKVLKKKFKVTRAPFGWYKSFDIACKGHPLSELSREFSSGEGKGKVKEKELTGKEIGSLLKQISRSRLDTSELKDNDHRIIGQKLDLWSFNEVAPGMVFWHDKGLLIKNLLVDYWRGVHKKAGYQEISTPQILDKKLWLLSGHWAKFKENMFITGYEKREFAVKPMNCPGGMLVYKASSKSYKDLPLRVGELGIVHRQELSGVLAGLFRVIQFTQDDAHIFCTEEQIEKEVGAIIDIVKEMFATFNLKCDRIELSTRPKRRIGSDKMWDLSEKALESVLKKRKVKYKINAGDGAFYGPKIDFHLKDSLGRSWQCSTIQLDMALPERFDLKYAGKKGEAKRPIMLHRVVYGAIERFIGIVTEHLNGNFPLWLSPVQVKVVTVTNRNVNFASKVMKKLEEAGLRAELNDQTETMGKKIREAQVQRINYIVTIGDKEVKSKKLAVKSRTGEIKFGVSVDKFIKDLLKEIEKKEIK